MTLTEHALAGFAEAFGEAARAAIFVPGRVNLMGDHVDYNDGLVLPMAISAGTAIAWGIGADDQIEALALDFDGTHDRFGVADVTPHAPADWRSYVRGMAACMALRGLPVGAARLAIAGSIPRGSGLSSSASLCVAVGRALSAAAGVSDPDPRELALAAQAAEHQWAGVNCGIMDQMAVAVGAPGEAVLLDCRDLAVRSVPLPADWAVLIVQSGVVRGLVDGLYNARRADCESGAQAMGLGSLRNATLAQIGATALNRTVRARAVHVVNEMARTNAAVAAIEARDLAALGAVMRASHASLRDLFEVSVPAVDRLADLLNTAIGAAGGARMTGGGFGGAVVAVLADREVPRVLSAIEANYAAPGGAPVAIMIEGSGGPPGGIFA